MWTATLTVKMLEFCQVKKPKCSYHSPIAVNVVQYGKVCSRPWLHLDFRYWEGTCVETHVQSSLWLDG